MKFAIIMLMVMCFFRLINVEAANLATSNFVADPVARQGCQFACRKVGKCWKLCDKCPPSNDWVCFECCKRGCKDCK